MDDSETDVKEKLRKHIVNQKKIEGNPLLDWTKWILLPILGKLLYQLI